MIEAGGELCKHLMCILLGTPTMIIFCYFSQDNVNEYPNYLIWYGNSHPLYECLIAGIMFVSPVSSHINSSEKRLHVIYCQHLQACGISFVNRMKCGVNMKIEHDVSI